MKKLTYDNVKTFIEDRGCKLLDAEYINQNKELSIVFACGHTDKRSFAHFKYYKNICPRCAGCKPYKYADAKSIFENHGFCLLSDNYSDCKKSLDIQDGLGYKYTISLDKFLNNFVNRGSNLARFDIHNIYTVDNICLFLSINFPQLSLIPKQEWKGNNAKMSFIDYEGYKYYVTFGVLQEEIKRNSFPAKFDISNIHTMENISNWIAINKKDYRLLDGQTYPGAHGKLKFKCLKCPDEERPFERTWVGLRSKNGGCNYCNTTYIGRCNNLKYKEPDIALEWDYDRNYPVIPDNVAAHASNKYWWICGDCGASYLSTTSHRTGKEPRGCPQCSESNMEKRIRKYLLRQNVSFEPQKWFEKCRNILPLPFDFYLMDYNVLIEAQGIQHFKPVEYFGGEEYFVKRKNNDLIKNNYCKNNGIKLIEIPYWDYKNIENILIKELNL